MPQLTQVSAVPERQIHWLWKGRIPRGVLTIIEGDPGTSKSQLTCKLAAHLSHGLAWPDGEQCPLGASILANAEDPVDAVIKPRLRASGADLSMVWAISPTSEEASLFTIPDNVKWLEDQIKDRGVRLVVFDPLEAFINPAISTKENQHIRRGLKCLEMMAERLDLAVVIVRHLVKDDKKAALYRGGGSIGIIGAARSGLVVAHDPTTPDRCIVAPVKANWMKMRDALAYKVESFAYQAEAGEIETSRIVWDGEVNVTADQLVQRGEDDGPEDQASPDIARMLREELADGIRPSKAVLQAAKDRGFSRDAVFATMRLMNLRVTKDNGEWHWELPDPEMEAVAARFAGVNQAD